jgi:single-strand DNA-binding protein
MNRAILIGNLTKDTETRTTPNGINVCTFSIAVNRRRANQQGEHETDFFNIVAWRGLGDICAKYLDKGKKVCVTGEIQTRSYDGKDGVKRYVTEIIADDVEFLTPRDTGGYNPSDPTAGFEEIEDDHLPF